MLQYDLSETSLAKDDRLPRIPTEGEMLAILVALMLAEQCTFEQLTGRMLTLTEANRETIAHLIEERLSPFAPDTGTGPMLRDRLRELVGLQIRRVGR